MKEAKLLAKLIKDAARIREESYDTAKAEERERTLPIHQVASRYAVMYKLTVQQAVARACADHMEFSELITSMLHCMWNQSLEWAEVISISKEKKTDE